VKHATRAGAAPAGYSGRPLLDKLGVKPDMRVAVIGLEDPGFMRELRGRTEDVALGRPRRDTAMVVLAVERPAQLARLATLERTIARNGAIWVVWPKGGKTLTENTIRDAALARGLVDIKVAAFSDTLSALKLVIPVARR
jgi:hypothetical protein